MIVTAAVELLAVTWSVGDEDADASLVVSRQLQRQVQPAGDIFRVVAATSSFQAGDECLQGLHVCRERKLEQPFRRWRAVIAVREEGELAVDAWECGGDLICNGCDLLICL